MHFLKKLFGTGILGFCSILVYNCVEPFELATTNFESILVIEGTITDRQETQRIVLSRTFPLDTIVDSNVGNAKVLVQGSDGESYGFIEIRPGEYHSTQPFNAKIGISYTLAIETAEGFKYNSEPVTIASRSTIENVYTKREINDSGEDGVFIYVDSFDPTGQSKYYQYEYEETYKIIAPYWSNRDAYVVSPLPNPQVDLRSRMKEERVCYGTVASKRIIQKNTTGLNEDRVSQFPVRFIAKSNYILTHRYSILVKQYVQSRDAYSYYENLEALSSSESLFAQLQTGFLEGNIKPESDVNEKVIGFFQASSVAEKRIFFDFDDVLSGERLPDYAVDCNLVSPPIIDEAGSSPLIDAINQGILKYVDKYDESNPNRFRVYGPYLMVQTPCSDCTALGSNVKPEFWEE